MGSRAMNIIVFRGRYFVYYNMHDSHPSGLGKELVDGIPTDPEKYRVWLEKGRARYAGLSIELDEDVLFITKDMMTDVLAQKPTSSGSFWGDEQRITWKEIDSELEELPSALCNVGNEIMIEWVYIIDLDREIFSIDNWIFFELYNIPRDRWIKAFGYDDVESKVFSFEICPEASTHLEPPRYFADKAESDCNRYRDIYQQYSLSTVKAMNDINVFSRAALQQILGVMIFEYSTGPFAAHFWNYLPSWGHENFAFREVAFAYLSFAAGRYYFDEPDRFHGCHLRDETNGFIVDRNEGGEPKLMPLFASGCHAPSQAPGSAPGNSIYWFENVLVSLVPDTAFEQDREAAIAKAVEYGLQSRTKINVKDGVKMIRCTDVVCIYAEEAKLNQDKNADDSNKDDYGNKHTHDDMNMDDDRNSKGDNNDNNPGASPIYPTERTCHRSSGFVALQNFFNTAGNRQVAVFNRGCFPTEIYANIIANVDSPTRHACAQVSRPFRMLCQEFFSFSPNLTMIKFEGSAKNPRGDQWYLKDLGNIGARWFFRDVNNLGIFTFQDQRTGNIMLSRLNIRSPNVDKRKISTWCPVVGDESRPSMMTPFCLRVLLQAQNENENENENQDGAQDGE